MPAIGPHSGMGRKSTFRPASMWCEPMESVRLTARLSLIRNQARQVAGRHAVNAIVEKPATTAVGFSEPVPSSLVSGQLAV